MVVFPNAKINIGLNIIQRLPNGYHEIESCLYPIGWSDILEIIPSQGFSFQHSGLSIDGDLEQNLCVKAYRLLKEEYDLPPISIYLHKIIPMGAGLGGGSSDAAFTLKALNNLFDLDLEDSQLESYAAKLGSDCPFFIGNKPMMATGTGTDLSELNLDLGGKFLVTIKPDVHSGTASAYQGVVPRKPDHALGDLLKESIQNWKNKVINQFEETIFKNQSEIERLKNQLYENGALYASMTGSGSAVFGFFDFEPDLSNLISGVKDENSVWVEQLKTIS